MSANKKNIPEEVQLCVRAVSAGRKCPGLEACVQANHLWVCVHVQGREVHICVTMPEYVKIFDRCMSATVGQTGDNSECVFTCKSNAGMSARSVEASVHVCKGGTCKYHMELT